MAGKMFVCVSDILTVILMTLCVLPKVASSARDVSLANGAWTVTTTAQIFAIVYDFGIIIFFCVVPVALFNLANSADCAGATALTLPVKLMPSVTTVTHRCVRSLFVCSVCCILAIIVCLLREVSAIRLRRRRRSIVHESYGDQVLAQQSLFHAVHASESNKCLRPSPHSLNSFEIQIGKRRRNANDGRAFFQHKVRRL
jgi:hypothetical protein